VAGRVKFVMNRAAFRRQVLKSDGVREHLAAQLQAAAPAGTHVESDNTRSRARARLVDPAGGLEREAASGHLSRALAQVPGASAARKKRGGS